MKILIWEVMKEWVHPQPLEEKLAEEMKLTQQELLSAEHTIYEQRFLRHMALAKIEALEDWHHGRCRPFPATDTRSGDVGGNSDHG